MRAPGVILICIAAALISGAAYASANPFYLDGGYFNEKEALEAGMVLRELYKDPASEKNLVISDGFGGTLVIEEGKVYQYDEPSELIVEEYMDARSEFVKSFRRRFTDSAVTIGLYAALFLCLAYAVVLYATRQIREYRDKPAVGKYDAEKCAAKICAAAFVALQLFHNTEIRYEAPKADKPAQALAAKYEHKIYGTEEIDKLIGEYSLRYELAAEKGKI